MVEIGAVEIDGEKNNYFASIRFSDIPGWCTLIYNENSYPRSHQVERIWVHWRITGDTLRKHETGYNQKNRDNSNSECNPQFNNLLFKH